MLVFPSMLVPAAERVGMAVPPDPDKYAEVKDQYPHFFVFCQLQLARRVAYHGEHWDNAQVIVGIPVSELKKMTLEDFLAKGLSYAH